MAKKKIILMMNRTTRRSFETFPKENLEGSIMKQDHCYRLVYLGGSLVDALSEGLKLGYKYQRIEQTYYAEDNGHINLLKMDIKGYARIASDYTNEKERSGDLVYKLYLPLECSHPKQIKKFKERQRRNHKKAHERAERIRKLHAGKNYRKTILETFGLKENDR